MKDLTYYLNVSWLLSPYPFELHTGPNPIRLHIQKDKTFFFYFKGELLDLANPKANSENSEKTSAFLAVDLWGLFILLCCRMDLEFSDQPAGWGGKGTTFPKQGQRCLFSPKCYCNHQTPWFLTVEQWAKKWSVFWCSHHPATMSPETFRQEDSFSSSSVAFKQRNQQMHLRVYTHQLRILSVFYFYLQ